MTLSALSSSARNLQEKQQKYIAMMFFFQETRHNKLCNQAIYNSHYAWVMNSTADRARLKINFLANALFVENWILLVQDVS